MSKEQRSILVILGLLVFFLFTQIFVMVTSALGLRPLTTNQQGAPSFDALCNPGTLERNPTRAQINAYADSVKGTRVKDWKRFIYQVDSSNLFGVTTFWIKTGNDPKDASWDTQLSSTDKNSLSLSKGQEFTFSGTITFMDMFSPGTCSFYLDADP